MQAYRIPLAFLGYNISFLAIFTVITLIVSIFAYKIYKLTKQNQLKLFSIAFLMFSIGYILRIIMFLIVKPGAGKVMKGLRHAKGTIRLNSLFALKGTLGNFHVLFIMAGLIILVYMTLKAKNKNIILLLFGVIAISLIFTQKNLLQYHLISSLLFLFITHHYYINYKKHKQPQTLIVLFAFIFLLLGQISLIFSINNEFFFILGRSLQLMGYLNILTNLILAIKK